ncbi:MAG TPA: universal stress protein [Solirubrobacteraceae bacterium]|jgi:nucleotide-binding universal stress UspA family protein|nr:universal stress protein [Solirubrobacteraceae bacterium]
MAPETAQGDTQSEATGPVLLAYDGSDLAGFAIEQAGEQLVPGRDALVVCVWQPADVGFVPVDGRHLHAAAADEVRAAAEETAAHGASLAEAAGFRSRSMTVQAAPTWQGLVSVAEERGASLIVLGSHCRTGLLGHFQGSVAAATVAHSRASVLVVHRRT